MQRLWILAVLVCGSLILSGCGGEKKQTADNSSNSSDSSSSSSRPKRNSSGSDSNSNSGQSSQQKMNGDPERRNGQDPNQNMQSGGMQSDPRMSGDPRMNKGSSNGEPKKPDYVSQEEWDKMSPGAKSRFTDLAVGGGGGGSSAAGGGQQMQGDPRMNGGGDRGQQNQQGEMTGDPRMSGGGRTEGGVQQGQMQGDPRQGSGSGSSAAPGGGAGSSAAPGAGNASPPGGFGGSGMQGDPRGGGGSGRQNAEPVTLKDKAIKAFQDGDDDGGFQYMYGHFIAEDDGRKSVPLQFLPTAKRPRTAMRWGIGVVYKTNKGFEGDPPKIGEQPNVLPQPRGSRNNRGGRGGGIGGAPGAAGGSSGPGVSGSGGGGFGNRNSGSPTAGGMEELKYYTGEVGEILVEMLDKLRARGQFGKMIAKVDASAGGGGQSRGFTVQNSGGGGASIDDGRTAADRNRFGRSSGGNQQSNANNRNNADAASPYKNVLPGVLMLGKSSLKTLANRARARGIDVLVVFDVNCKLVPSNGQKLNDTKISLYDVTGDAPVRVGKPSSTLNNLRVWLAREKNSDEENDPVRNGVKKIFESGTEGGFLDSYKVASMPELDEGQVMNRLKSLISETQAAGNPMVGIVELTFYRQKGLLPEKAFIDSVNKLAGSEIGDTLLNGAEKDRVKAIESMLPPEWKVNEGAGEDADEDVL